ncbi:membrane protein [Leminorella grimontii]|uniref:Membrane protein n=1 Tax=Leminorella grimontii TaxID=82981 RepID=A0AAV5MZX9_9GAMM|nr:MAPEG family protein [Leminorella grimontii]KFC95975.1 putative inner membrane protein [Leminorella grimontii ATCC 33999 = DSM 5078]GKX54845.1 membrane protein [Leminorella grimontii]GKX58263.1 membrane protein [Leminorella grimontii]VFS58335.1 Inner membrane protein yecN [Leminorella grimontii]
MVSALYAVLGALLLFKLSLNVVKLRTQYRVPFGDGGFYELQTAIRIHGNAVENIPIALILMVIMEMNGANIWLVHACGIMLFAGRFMHYYGLHHRDWRFRRSGMSATYISIGMMACANVYYLPWEQLFILY